MADQQQQLQALSDGYQKLQTDLQNAITSRQKLESQQQENKAVAAEFASLPTDDDDADEDDVPKIYKLVGPVLLKQERAEAVMAVKERLEFIDGQIKRVDKTIQELQDKSDKIRGDIMQIQAAAQQQPPGQQHIAA